MQSIEAIRSALPEAAKDLRLNLQTLLASQILSPAQVWSIALASAYFLREDQLRDAILADAQAAGVPPAYLEDAQAAAALMGMNTVFYRFRHMIGKETYSQRPARLRMQRIAQPLTNKGDFELMSLACAALAGCEMCLKAHEASVLQHAMTEDHVLETIRLAATLHGVAIALPDVV